MTSCYRCYIDDLDRLIQDQITSTPASTRSFTYDSNGNRTSDSAGSYVYAAATNRLTQTPSTALTLDAAGNTLSDGTYTYSYNQDGHLHQVLSGGNVLATYTYNRQRQRTRKVTAAGTTVYHYELAGNLIAETQANGALIRDYLWLEGTPLAQIAAGASEALTYLHADHLATPRVGTDPSQAVVWRWAGEAFGDTEPTGGITVDLRFAGQYFDAETGLYYNWNRYYDPRTGRYITSDSIGLGGGLNTYTYAQNSPLRYIDPDGLFVRPGPMIEPILGPVVRPGPKVPAPGMEPLPPGVPAPGLEPSVPTPDPDSRPWRKKPGHWKVYVRCNVTKFEQSQISPNATCENDCPPPATIGGWGYGNTFGDAFANAQHDANQNLGDLGKRGCYPRHCQPVSCFENGRQVPCPKSGR